MRFVPHSGLANGRLLCQWDIGAAPALGVVRNRREGAALPQPPATVKREAPTSRGRPSRSRQPRPAARYGPNHAIRQGDPGKVLAHSASRIMLHPDMSQPSSPAPVALTATRPIAPLAGKVAVPGDKSISHRALMFGALAVGCTEITGLLEGEDVLATAAALRAIGAGIEQTADGIWRVDGVGVGGLGEPEDVLDLGNSGTSARLLLGMLATHRLTAFVTGDGSLRQRPMRRGIDPLSRFGARFVARESGRLPLAVTGTADPVPLEYRLPVPSAQVKSAVLLAGLNTPGVTSVIENEPTRDHTERMLRHFGATIRVADEPGAGRRISVEGQPELKAAPIIVPGDPSSAAFPLVAALIVPGSEIRIENVGLNPSRTGLLTSLVEMGADIEFENRREAGGEPVADLLVRAGSLRGIEVPPGRAPSMIDEYPILAMAA